MRPRPTRHLLETRRFSAAVAVAANQQTDGDSGTSAARCPGERGTGWRVRYTQGLLARNQWGRAARHHKASLTSGRGVTYAARTSGCFRAAARGLLLPDS